MAQPTRKTNNSQKPRSRTVKKNRKPSVSEIIKKNIERSKKPHPKYGTSKLEKKFAKEFLDKLGVEYEEQFEAKDIKRFFDFKIKGRVLIEIDGDYYHSYGKVYEEMNPMQKKNARVDALKNKWAHSNGYKLIRIWEHDINENPKKVMKLLRDELDIIDKKEDKKKRH